MAITISLQEFQVFSALRSFLLGVLPNTTQPGGASVPIPVIRGQDNRVAEPAEADFVVMTPLFFHRLGTNIDTYDTVGGTMIVLQPYRYTVQLDFHGKQAADSAQIVSALFRDDYAVQQFASSGFAVEPLYCEDALQTPFINENQQVEYRWTVDVQLECDPTITVQQQFANALNLGLVSVEASYPP